MRLYLVTLRLGEKSQPGRSYYVTASSEDSARQIVLDFEPFYNPAWRIDVRAAE